MFNSDINLMSVIPMKPSYLLSAILAIPNLYAAIPLDDPLGSNAARVLGLAGLTSAPYNSSGVVAGGVGIEGQRSTFFTGSTPDFISLLFSPFIDNFPRNECTVIGFAKVQNAAVWLDGIFRGAISVSTASNYIGTYKANTNNFLRSQNRVGVASPNVNLDYSPFSSINWFQYALRYSVSLNRLALTINGVEVASDSGNVTAFTNVITGALIGRNNVSQNWKGWLQDLAFVSRYMSNAELLSIYNVADL